MNQSKFSIMKTVKKRLIGGLKPYLNECLAIGIFGSLARKDFDFKKSDIDIFVIVDKFREDENDIWRKRITEVLKGLGRDVTVIVYTLKAIRDIVTWYVLRLASEGTLIFDKGDVKQLFKKIVSLAKKSGLRERKTEDGKKVWGLKPPVKFGTIFELKLEE